MIYNFCTYIKEKTRVDTYLSTLFSDFSRSYIQKLIDTQKVCVNWKILDKNKKIWPKDHMQVEIIIESLELKWENIPIDIIYEDENIAIINKDPKINTHPTPWIEWQFWTLVNACLYHLKNLWWINWSLRPWIVHRLDKDTSWVIMIAKNDYMMTHLQNTIKERKKINKYYLAIVYWIIENKEEFKIESFIWRHKTDRTRITSKNPINPKLAISYVKTLKYIDNKYTLVLVKIETWRTHQIRVHLSSIWFPIIWDKVYWDEKINLEVLKKYGLDRQALHAYKLDIFLYWKIHTFIAPLKNDMQKIIQEFDIL